VNSQWKKPLLPVTNPGPRPGDFPIGSLESRAAARALVESESEMKETLRIVVTFIKSDGSVAGTKIISSESMEKQP
jgi:hypothetical protein